jgi:hypothetical protein
MTSGRLPTFLVIGAMKAGTTSLWHQLRVHPQVFMPEVKELHYFSNTARLARGLDWYRGQFELAGEDAVAIGEASTNYTKYPRLTGTPGRIAGVIPDVRLVYLVRDPFSRMRSHYLHVVHGHGETRSFPVAVREDPEYLDISRYRTQIDQYLEHFDPSQLLVITAEDLRRDGATTVNRVLEFVGAPPLPVRPTVNPVRVTPSQAEKHRSADKRVETGLSVRVRRLPGYALARRLTPRPVRRMVSRTTTRPVASTVDTTVPDDLRAEIVAQLRDEVAGLRPFLGTAFDGWGIA